MEICIVPDCCEKRCTKLEQENRNLHAFLEDVEKHIAMINNDLAVENCRLKDKASAWDKRCYELEEEVRDLQQEHREMLDRVHAQDLTIAKYDDENRELTKKNLEMLDKIAELREANEDGVKDVLYYKNLAEQYKYERDLTIAKYDQENLELKKQLEEATTAQVHDAGVFLNGNTQVLGEIVDLKKRNGELLKELDLVRKCAFLSQDIHSLNKWAVWIHEIAVKHGWWETEDGACDDGDRPLPEILMLCVTELAEAMEEYRNGKPLAYVEREAVEPTGLDSVPIVLHYPVEDSSKWEPDEKPEGIAIEMLDCVIRILDWMAHQNVDIDLLMRKKVKFNESRSHRHGGKKA